MAERFELAAVDPGLVAVDVEVGAAGEGDLLLDDSSNRYERRLLKSGSRVRQLDLGADFVGPERVGLQLCDVRDAAGSASEQNGKTPARRPPGSPWRPRHTPWRRVLTW